MQTKVCANLEVSATQLCTIPHPQREIHALLLRDHGSAKISPGCSMLYHNEKRKENFQSFARFGGFPAQVGRLFLVSGNCGHYAVFLGKSHALL